MVVVSCHPRYSLEEFLRLEEYSNVRHEYLDGLICAMAGGTPEHGAKAMRVGAALVAQLRGRPCNVYSSDVRVRVTETGLDTYPDLSVVCGQEQRDSRDRLALVNPILLVEVLSPNTEEYDRGEKLDHYRRIPTLREVVLVSHELPAIEVYAREEGGTWTRRCATAGGSIRLSSIDCVLEVDDVYVNPLA